MKYYFYRTTNTVNGKFYYGVRHSENPEKDSYLGSGLVLKEAIQKYGREKFRKDILEYFPSMEKAYEREAEIVTDDLVSNPMCYNVKHGGKGGLLGTTIIHKGQEIRRVCEISVPKYEALGWVKGYPEETNLARVQARRGYRHSEETRKKIGEKSAQRKHTEESKNLMSIKHRGNLSTSGMIWVTNELEDRHIRPEELNVWVEKGYRKGRKKSSIAGFNVNH